MNAGQRLKEIRERYQMTQAQLAAKLGVSEFTVCRYENGQIALSTKAIKKITAIFDTCPGYFLADGRCGLGRDLELIDVFRRADRLNDAQRALVKNTLHALLASLTESERDL